MPWFKVFWASVGFLASIGFTTSLVTIVADFFKTATFREHGWLLLFPAIVLLRRFLLVDCSLRGVLVERMREERQRAAEIEKAFPPGLASLIHEYARGDLKPQVAIVGNKGFHLSSHPGNLRVESIKSSQDDNLLIAFLDRLQETVVVWDLSKDRVMQLTHCKVDLWHTICIRPTDVFCVDNNHLWHQHSDFTRSGRQKGVQHRTCLSKKVLSFASSNLLDAPVACATLEQGKVILYSLHADHCVTKRAISMPTDVTFWHLRFTPSDTRLILWFGDQVSILDIASERQCVAHPRPSALNLFPAHIVAEAGFAFPLGWQSRESDFVFLGFSGAGLSIFMRGEHSLFAFDCREERARWSLLLPVAILYAYVGDEIIGVQFKDERICAVCARSGKQSEPGNSPEGATLLGVAFRSLVCADVNHLYFFVH